MDHCKAITDKSFLSASFSQLLVLDLNFCRQLQDDSVIQIIKSSKNLTILRLSYCYNLTDKVLKALVDGEKKTLPNLKRIHLDEVGNITERAARSVLRVYGDQLDNFSVNGCENISSQLITEMKEKGIRTSESGLSFDYKAMQRMFHGCP